MIKGLKSGLLLGQECLGFVWYNLRLILYPFITITLFWVFSLLLYQYSVYLSHESFFAKPLAVEQLDVFHVLTTLVQPYAFAYYGFSLLIIFIKSFITLFFELCLILHAIDIQRMRPTSYAQSICKAFRKYKSFLTAVCIYSLGNFLIFFSQLPITQQLEAYTFLIPASSIVTTLLSAAWYFATLFLTVLVAFSDIHIATVLQKSLSIVRKRFSELLGGLLSIRLTSLIIIPITLIGPMILISVAPQLYLIILLIITSPLAAFFSAGTSVLLLNIYERYREKTQATLPLTK